MGRCTAVCGKSPKTVTEMRQGRRGWGTAGGYPEAKDDQG